MELKERIEKVLSEILSDKYDCKYIPYFEASVEELEKKINYDHINNILYKEKEKSEIHG